jgi:hypothetical protein
MYSKILLIYFRITFNLLLNYFDKRERKRGEGRAGKHQSGRVKDWLQGQDGQSKVTVKQTGIRFSLSDMAAK